MMEDWTDIIGEELKNVEEPLPADDWSLLQQKYAVAQRRKKAAAFAWAGGITSLAAALALMFLLVRPDSTVVENDLVAKLVPPIEEAVTFDSSLVESPIDTALYVAPPVQKKVSVPADAVKKPVADVLAAENNTGEIPSEKTEEVFDVLRDTTSLKDKLLAEADASNRKAPQEEEHAQSTEASVFDDFTDDGPGRRRRPMSIGISGSVSVWDSPVVKVMNDSAPKPPDDQNPDSLAVETPKPAMMRARSGYSDSYQHEIPVAVGLSARFFITDRLSINTGLNYTRYKSLRNRWFAATYDQQKDWQYVHYLGVPVRLDYMAVNRKNFNLYFGAGLQMDKCVYATVGEERLREKQLLFGLNGAMGLQVNIVPMAGLYFEPEVSYALNKGSIETFRSDEPFVVTIRGGLRFNF